MRKRSTSILSLTAAVFWKWECRRKPLNGGTGTNLILGIDNGNGFQDGFEGTKRFGRPLRETDHKCGTHKTPLHPTSIPN